MSTLHHCCIWYHIASGHILMHHILCTHTHTLTAQHACASCRNTEPISSGNRGLFAFVFAMLLVPAGIILAIAFSSGYMVRSSNIHLDCSPRLQCCGYRSPDVFKFIDCLKSLHALDSTTFAEMSPREELHAVQDTISNGVQQ